MVGLFHDSNTPENHDVGGHRTRWRLLRQLPEPGSGREDVPDRDREDLEKTTVTLPKAYEGAPAVYMVGYRQNTQFDLDRWTIGLLQADFPCRIVEVPTIPGLVPGMIKGTIDDGMRSGIPREDWASVVTLYGGAAEPVAKFTGNENPRNGRILLIDAEGKVAWFWDQGFSAKRVLELSKLAGELAR